jgi:thiol-disulfide isomerase/thioredoxin
MVRNRALFALASVVQRGGEARQPEAERLYHQFITEFKDQPQAYNPDVFIEKMYLTQAQAEIAEIGSRGLGKPAPELEGEDLAGKPLKLSEFRGKVVLLSFWATWCRPCMRMVPHEKSLVNRLPSNSFAVVGVNGDVDPKQLRDVIENENITWRSFKNKAGGQRAISEKWNIPGWPTVYLIDQKGIIRNRWTDTVPPEVLNREVDDLISGKSKSTSGIWSLLPTWSLSVWIGIGILGAVAAAAITGATMRRHSLPQ